MLARIRGLLRRRPHVGPILLICAIVVVANGLYLTGIRSDDPLGSRAALAPAAHGWIAGRTTVDTNDGYTTQALGRLAARDLLHGHLPLWNEYEGVGMPLLGESQSAALFPPTVLNLLPDGILIEHVLLEMVAGVATYLLLVRLRRSRLAAVAGGASFAVMGVFVWLTNAAFNPIAFLPVCLYAVEGLAQAARNGRRSRDWALLGLGVGLSLLAGFPETAVLDGLLIAAFAMLRWLQLRGARRAFTVGLLGGVVAGVALAAPALVAFIDYLGFSAVGQHSDAYGHLSMPLAGLPMLGMPYVYGPIAARQHQGSATIHDLWGAVGGYVPLATLIVSGIAFRRAARTPETWLFGVVGVVSLARIYGLPPIIWIFSLVPGMAKVDVVRYLPTVVAMCACVLVAYGIDAIGLSAPRRWRAVIFGLAAVAAVALLALPTVRDSVVAGRWWWYALSVGWSTVTLLVIAVGLKNADAGRARRTVAAVVLLDAAVMFMVPQLSAPSQVQIDQPAISFLQSHVGLGRAYSISVMAPNYGSYFGIGQLNVNDLPFPRRFEQYAEADLDPGTIAVPIFPGSMADRTQTVRDRSAAFIAHFEAFREAGVAYVVTAKNQLTMAQGYSVGMRLVYHDPFIRIWQVGDPKPYFDIIGAPCQTEFTSRYAVTMSCTQPSTLVRREMYAPGWSVEVNGRAAPINAYAPPGSSVGLFQSVELPAGDSRVTFSYRPRGFAAAAAAAAASGLALLAAAVTGLVRVRRRKQ